MNIQDLIRDADMRCAAELSSNPTESTGFHQLDGILPGRGWPKHGLTEVFTKDSDTGSMRLFLPTLAKLSQQKGWIVLNNPPHIPYAPALRSCGVNLARFLVIDLKDTFFRTSEEMLWAYEEALHFKDCFAALLWLGDIKFSQLRRLQLAAEAGCTWGILFRPFHNVNQISPSSLRIRVSTHAVHEKDSRAAEYSDSGYEVTVVGGRGNHMGKSCYILGDYSGSDSKGE